MPAMTKSQAKKLMQELDHKLATGKLTLDEYNKAIRAILAPDLVMIL